MILTFWQTTSFLVALLAFATAFVFFCWVGKLPQSNGKIRSVGALIKDGADAFMKREYNILSRFVLITGACILLFLPKPIWTGDALTNITMTAAFVAGSVFSATAGKIGIKVATTANMKTAEAAKKGIAPAFSVGFRGGAVMGMAVVGASLMGVTAVYMLTGGTSAVLGFSFGASSLALFAKAGGGIFTKSADISADLVGKVELGIPEDDPRNPAVIADNVGDNVGDVAGMGADLFDSNVASMAAALVMSSALDSSEGGLTNTSTVFCYSAIGLLCSIIGVLSAKMGKNGNPTNALNRGTYVTTLFFAAFTAVATYFCGLEWRIWFASVIGLAVGLLIGIVTDYFTDDRRSPVRKVAKASSSGAAFTVLSGISYGFISTLPALVGIGISALLSYKICEPLGDGYAMFGISMAAVGMLSIVGIIVSNDAYGPIVDNARGLAEMGGLGDDVIKVADELDSAGNTVKAVTKGFAIGAAGLTVISLLGAFISEVNSAAAELGIDAVVSFDIMNPIVFFGILTGAAVPPVFCAMLILGVDKNAQRMVSEIHRQFREISGLREGRAEPEYGKCIDIAASGALNELIPAGILTVFITLAVGFIGGVTAIGGYLAGNIVSGLVFAMFMSNSGGLWDNAKKYIESGAEGGKGSAAHRAAVVGDTVGDPFKDTAGPSINTQITVVSLVSSLVSTLFLTFSVF